MSIYCIEQDTPGCNECGEGATWWVIGPDGVASSISYGDKEEAEFLARALNAAYELGRQSTPANPWVKFSAETPPPRSTHLLAWDAEFNATGSMYTSGPDGVEADLQHARIMKYSHWMLATAMRGPPKEELPVIEQVTIEPAPEVPTPLAAPSDAPADFWDDVPF